MSPHAARFQDALVALVGITAWGGGWIPVDLARPGHRIQIWIPVEDSLVRTGQRLADFVQHRDETYSDEIRIGLPRRERGWGTASPSSVLWAATETPDQVKALQRFRPAPTLVLREGSSSRRMALWALERPLAWEWCVRANKRIAHRLRAPKKFADPDLFAVPAPGTCLHLGRARPAPVSVELLEPVAYTARAVVGRLKDAPDPQAWRRTG